MSAGVPRCHSKGGELCGKHGSGWLSYPLSPIHSSLLLEAPASGEASLLSEGLRESLSSYISLTEDNSLDDA